MGHAEEAHDPSMEEILASIRKIIAEDTGGAAPARPSHLSVVPDPAADENAPAPAETAEVEAEPDAEAEPEGEAEALAPEAEPAEAEEAATTQDEVAAPEDEAPEDGAGEAETADDPVLEAWAQEFDESDATAEEDEKTVAEDETGTDAGEGEDVSPDLAAIAAAMSTDKAEGYRDENGRLLSPQADRAVHSAFDQLASTILSDQARTLEDLVKDMMRPMLKHWLDDNLPVLVERLVREEIERVSRGRR